MPTLVGQVGLNLPSSSGKHDMTTKRKNRRWMLGCLGVIVIIGFGVIAYVFAIPKILSGAPSSVAPRVQIRLPTYGSRLLASESHLVVLQAFNFKSVARYELWVDGDLVAFETPSLAATAIPTTSRLLWLPGEPGI